ncbi:hypothetical protein NKH77_20215 [Streptomyces sp. M19]
MGALMNARGLMQLIALNIGLEEEIITRELFSALVLVALVTTVMATPALSWMDRRRARVRRRPSRTGRRRRPTASRPERGGPERERAKKAPPGGGAFFLSVRRQGLEPRTR